MPDLLRLKMADAIVRTLTGAASPDPADCHPKSIDVAGLGVLVWCLNAMPWTTITVRVARTFVPPEASELAAEFRRTAGEFRGESGDLRGIWDGLDQTWDGVSNDRFNLEFGPRPGQLNALAEWLEAAAGDLERTEVTIWETEERLVWVG